MGLSLQVQYVLGCKIKSTDLKHRNSVISLNHTLLIYEYYI